ncbi:hypothetical protein, partial [Modestobacter versicolor]
GRELSGVVAALEGSPTLSLLRQEADDAYLDVCGRALFPSSVPARSAGLRAIIGAGDALFRDVLADRITPTDACETLARVVAAVAASATPGSRPESPAPDRRSR